MREPGNVILRPAGVEPSDDRKADVFFCILGLMLATFVLALWATVNWIPEAPEPHKPYTQIDLTGETSQILFEGAGLHGLHIDSVSPGQAGEEILYVDDSRDYGFGTAANDCVVALRNARGGVRVFTVIVKDGACP